MRYVAELLLLIGGLGAAGYFIDRYLRARRELGRRHTVYFSGGQLDGQRRQVPELPKTLTHEDEIYRRDHVGPSEAIYVYVGSVDDPNVLSYEV